MHTKKTILSTLMFLAVVAVCFASRHAAAADQTPAIKKAAAPTNGFQPASANRNNPADDIRPTPANENISASNTQPSSINENISASNTQPSSINENTSASNTQPSSINENTSADDTRAVEQAAAQFYTSLNALFNGDAGPMQDVWSHADDVTYMGPVGGFQVGWQQVGTVWTAQSEMKLGGKIEPMAIHVNVGGNLASVQCLEVGNNLNAEGQPEAVSIRATSLFRKENGQWKMISHHTDLLSFLGEDAEETSDAAPDTTSDSTSETILID